VDWALLVSGIALLVGGANVWWNIHQDRKAAAATKKAVLRAWLDWKASPHKGLDAIIIKNQGPAPARHIHTFIGGASALHHPFFKAIEQTEIRGALGPGSTYQYHVDWATEDPMELSLTWSDASGQPGEFKTTVAPPPPKPEARFVPFN